MSLPYFPMFPADFEADTSHLTLEEDGAYNRLLRLCWMTPGCSLPADPVWIARRMRVDAETYARVVAPLIAEFFKTERGRVHSPRLTSISLETSEKHKRRVEAGKKGGRPRKSLEDNGSDESNAKAMPKQPEPEPEPDKEEGATAPCATSDEPAPGEGEAGGDEEGKAVKPRRPAATRFDEFWHEAYPHQGDKVGKAKCLTKYQAFVRDGVAEQAIIDGARRYAQSDKVLRGFVKMPLTWLNGRHWEDEIGAGRPSLRIVHDASNQPSDFQSVFDTAAAQLRAEGILK